MCFKISILTCIFGISLCPLNLFADQASQQNAAPSWVASKKLDKSRFTKLIFSDEFSASSRALPKWNRLSSGGMVCDNGLLKLGHAAGGLKFLPESLHTKDKFSFRYGLVTARVKFTDDAAVWPGLWLMGEESKENAIANRWSGSDKRVEIFSKTVGGDDMEIGMGWDCGGKELALLHKKYNAPGLRKGFHEMSLLWTEKEYIFYLDGEEFFRTGTLEQDQSKRYLAFFLKRIDGQQAKAQTTMEVDWIRIYQLPDELMPKQPKMATPDKIVLERKNGLLVPPKLLGYAWKLALQDDFDGTKIDVSKWTRQEDVWRKGGWWRAANVYLNGKGQLQIVVAKDKQKPDQYATGALHSRGKFEQAYGFFTTKAKTQTQGGHWSAFWLQCRGIDKTERDGGRDGAELDVFEKAWLEEKIDHGIHFDGYNKHHGKSRVIIEKKGLNDGYHEYSLCWTPEEYIFFIDGVESYRTNIGGVSNKPVFLIFSTEIGGWGGDIRNAKLPDYFLVESVHVYSLNKIESAK